MEELDYQFETECVNKLAECEYSLQVSREVSAKLAPRGVSLVDVYHIMREGRVIRSGMHDRAGLWIVRGTLVDGGTLDITILFRFSNLHVELLDIR